MSTEFSMKTANEDAILNTLRQIVGPTNATSHIVDLVAYEKDQNWPFVNPHLPDYVVKVHDKKEVREIVRFANRNKIPIVPLAAGINVRGLCIPTQGGIVLDMRDMNKILEVNTEMMTVTIQPGVTSAQLSAACRKYGVRPALTSAPDMASIFANYLLIGLYHSSSSDGNFHILSMEVVLASGEILKTGSRGLVGAPGPHARGGGPGLTELFMGSPGSFGVVTEMTAKLYPDPKFSAGVAYGYDEWEPAVEVGTKLMDARVATQIDIIDDNLLITFLPTEMVDRMGEEAVRKMLPKVVMICTITDTIKERMQVNKKVAQDICKDVTEGKNFGIASMGGLGELSSGGRITTGMLQKGYYHCFAFYAPLNKCIDYRDINYKTAEEHGYSADYDASLLAIPQAPWNGQLTYYELEVLTCDPTDPVQLKQIQGYSEDLVQKILDCGIYGWFRPYAEVIDVTIDRWGTTGEFIKRLKNLVDPNNIMNPGKFVY